MCVFRQGYALPANFTLLHNINTHQGGRFHGETMELEYDKKERNETHRQGHYIFIILLINERKRSINFTYAATH